MRSRRTRPSLSILRVLLVSPLALACDPGAAGADSGLVLVHEAAAPLRALAVTRDAYWIVDGRRVRVSKDGGASFARVVVGGGRDAPRRRRRPSARSEEAVAAHSELDDELDRAERWSARPRLRQRFARAPNRAVLRAPSIAAPSRRRKRRTAALRFVAATDRLVCAARRRALFCGAVTASRLHRLRLERDPHVTSLAAAAGLVAVGTRDGVFLVDADGRGWRRLRLDGPIRALGALGRGFAALTTAGLWRIDVEPAADVRARRLAGPSPALDRVPSLAVNGRELYIASSRGLWRRDGDGYVRVPAPRGAPLVVICGRRLAMGGRRGLFVLGPGGWQSKLRGVRLRGLACDGSRFVAAGDGGLWLEGEGSSGLAPSSLEVPRPRLGPRFGRRAWLAGFVPELLASARYDRGLNARWLEWPFGGPFAGVEGAWFLAQGTRLLGLARFEVFGLLRWPLGSARRDDAVAAARREDRREARRFLRAQRRRRHFVERWRRERGRAGGRQRWLASIAADEAKALAEALAPWSAR